MFDAISFNCMVPLEDGAAIADACHHRDEANGEFGINIGQDVVTSGRCMCPEVARLITKKIFEGAYPDQPIRSELTAQVDAARETVLVGSLDRSSADFELASRLADQGDHVSAIRIYRELVEAEESDNHAQFYSGMMLSCEQAGRSDLISSMLNDPRYYRHLKTRDAITMTLRWSAKLGNPVDDRAMLSAIHSTGALAAPEVLDELVFYILNQTPRDISRAEPYLALLQTNSYGQAACRILENFPIGKVRDLLSGNRFISDSEAIEPVADSIAMRRPFSLVRLGDGEGNILAHCLYPQSEFLGHMAVRILRHQFLDSMLPLTEYGRLFADLRPAIEQADLLGVPRFERIEFEFANDVRGYWGVYFAALYCCTQLQPRRFVSPNLADQLFRSPEIIAALRGAKAINTISCHSGFGPRIRQKLRIATGIDLTVPGEMAMSVLPIAARTGRHYPDAYQQLLKRIAEFEHGSVALVAAGICGKVYTHHAKMAGCCALDIGAIADLVMGYNTRGIFAQPSYRDTFTDIL
jgi:hypothetical protein